MALVMSKDLRVGDRILVVDSVVPVTGVSPYRDDNDKPAVEIEIVSASGEARFIDTPPNKQWEVKRG